jgi:hypothetical protein
MKKILKIIAIIILAFILLTPMSYGYTDGGTVENRAILYCVTNYHRLQTIDRKFAGYLTGIEVKVLGLTIYNNTRVTQS